MIFLGLAGSAVAQSSTERPAPTRTYHEIFPIFYEGEYKTALDRFLMESRGGIKAGQSRWIDSICYETMCGECYYEMGMYAKALDHYTAALEIYLMYPNWLVQVNFLTSQTIRRDVSLRKQVPWSTRGPQATLGAYPTTMLISMGQIDLTDTIRQGGVVQKATFYQIEPAEIIRCTVLAMRRRAELIGPMAAHDTLFDNLIAALSRRPGPPNHWSEAWVNVELGVALAAGGREGQAVTVLQRATIAAGEFEHPLTSTAHLVLGRLAMNRGDYNIALQHFEEATYAAFYYPDPGVLEEAFRDAALAHILATHKGMFPPLVPAVQWVKGTRLRQLQVSLLTLAAENNLVLGQTADAIGLLDDARNALGRHQMGAGRIGARRNFLSAAALFQARKIADGENALAAAMAFLHQSSLWLFHISLVDKYYSGGGDNASAVRSAVDLYQVVLRDPQSTDWGSDPMECLAVMTTPHVAAYEHWFEAAVARKEHELALEVADRTRRHRFLTTLPLGGRLESLRWVLEGPKEMLGPQASIQQRDLLTRYPDYEQLHQQVEDQRKKLAAMPLVPEKQDDIQLQTQALTKLAGLGRQQEAVLREMAVRREPATIVFPPQRSTADIQKALPKGHALLVFFATSRSLYAFLLDHDRYCDWPVSLSLQTSGRQTAALLREMGNIAAGHEIGVKDLAETHWKTTAKELLDGLLKGSRADFAAKFDELVIVPDGVLWYLPFEALQVPADGELHSLIRRFRIRYAPTAGLAVAPAGWGHRRGNTAVFAGRLTPHLDDEAVKGSIDELTHAIPGCVTLHSPLPAPAPIFANLLDRLIVLDDLASIGDAGPLGWSPLPGERGKSATTLADWLSLPWGGPEEIVLPGFHTTAEDSLKRATRSSPGTEVFTAVCGLMATGTRTILISRWRTGGQTSLDLVREFAQELPRATPADAWQRAILVVSNSRLNPEAEPRIKHLGDETAPRASHPFFWAGYMLVDSGVGTLEPEPAQPAPKAKAPAVAPPAAPPQDPDPAPKPTKRKSTGHRGSQ
jgi:tetratricopeptide (TPR) repeat protein